MTTNENFPLSQIDDADEEYQARLDYDEEEITRLAEDIQRNGQRNPIGIRPKGERYQLLYGFQRVKALKKLGLLTAKVNVYENLSDSEAREQAISDNVRHGDLTELEKARECWKLREKGYSIEQLCELFGVKKSVIYNFCSVSSLDVTTKYCLQRESITLNHAVELARINDISKRLETLKTSLTEKWSVRTLKDYQQTHSYFSTAPINGDYFPFLCPATLGSQQLKDCASCLHFKGIQEGEYWKRCLEYNDKGELEPSKYRKIICDLPLSEELKPICSFELRRLKINVNYAWLKYHVSEDQIEEELRKTDGLDIKTYLNPEIYEKWWKMEAGL